MEMLALRWEKAAVRWTDQFLCLTESERVVADRRGIKLEGKVSVIPNGVDLGRFGARDREVARNQLGLDAGPLVVCIGRLSEQKGQDLLLTAWAVVHQRIPDARLVLVGDGPLRQILQSQANGAVSLVGNAIDPRPWYAAANVVVVPSRWEGMALVPLEALASGRSVVMTDVSGALETVALGAGAIVPQEDPDAIAEALISRLVNTDAADAEGLAGQAYIREHYDVRVVGSRVLDLYSEVLERSDAP